MTTIGTKNTTTTQKSEPSPAALAAYNYVGNVASQAAQQPLQQYTGPRVAGFTPDQQSAFQAVQNAQGIATPYINTAAQYAAQAATPVTGVPTVGGGQVDYSAYTPQTFNAADLAQFYNPYQQSVIDATLANINRNNGIQQSQLLGNAIQSGASPFGGDRAGIAAAELARNQALASNQTIADLESQGYNTALGAYQTQLGQQNQAGLANAANALTASQSNATNALNASQANASNYLTNAQNNASRAANAAEQFAGLGSQAQSNALTGASALLQSGSLQQQLAQQQLDVPYQNFVEQQQYPLSMASFLVDAINGNKTNLGQTQTTTQPSGNTLTGITGLLTALGGLFKDGGAVEPGFGGIQGFDEGGPVSYQPGPAYGIATPMLNEDTFRFQGPSVDWSDTGATTGGIPAYVNALPQISLSSMPAPAVYQLPSGLLDALKAFPDLTKYVSTKKRAHGGGIVGYDGGGKIDDRFKWDFADAPSYDAMPLGDLTPVRAAGLGPANLVTAPPPEKVTAPTADAAMPAMSAPAPVDDQRPPADDIMAPPAPAAAADTDLSGIATILSGSPEQADAYLASPKAALLRAGLAMMASKSPNALQGIGEGALAGMDAYSKNRAAANALDAHPIIDDSGPTTRIYYPSEKKWVDTGIPTIKAQQLDLDKAKLAQASNGYRPATAEERAAYGVPPNVPLVFGPDGKPSTLGAPSTNVSVNAGATEMEKLMAQRYDKLTTEANAAVDQNSVLDRMSQLTHDPNFYSGAGGNQLLFLKQGIAALGGDPKAAASMEEFAGLANKTVIASMGGSLGTGFSNADRDFVVQTVPDLAATPQGNAQRIDVLRRINNRKIELAKMADQYVQDNGHLDAAFNQIIKQYGEDHPLFADLAKGSGAGLAPGVYNWTPNGAVPAQ